MCLFLCGRWLLDGVSRQEGEVGIARCDGWLTDSLPIKRPIYFPLGEPLAIGRDAIVRGEAHEILQHRCLGRMSRSEIDMNESGAVSACVNLKQTILGFVEPFNAVKLRCLDQVSPGVI